VAIAAADSLAPSPGDLATLVTGGKVVATAVIERADPGGLALATLASGSLAHQRLDRLRVRIERAPPRTLPRLRVGFPAPGRPGLLPACTGTALGAALVPTRYRPESTGPAAYRFVREPAAGAGPWPDTLVLRMFEDSADEEIALERGELDVAVFWPGELSAALRGDPRWRGFSYGRRARGVLLALAPAAAPGVAIAAPDSLALAALARDQLRGDLEPWAAAGARDSAAGAPPWRWEVEASIPGHAGLERFLNRAAPASPALPRRALLTFADLAVDAPVPDTLARPAGGPPRGFRAFALRCPVVFAPDLARTVAALGVDALVGLVDCGGRGSR